MSNILQEHKLTLLEHKFVLAEELNFNDIAVARTKLEQALKKETSNNVELVDAYDKYKRILSDTNTTANNTSDLTRLSNAFKEFWSKVFNSNYYKDVVDPNNMTDTGGTDFFKKNAKLVKIAQKILETTDLVLPDSDGKEINKKLLLNAAVNTEKAFDDARLKWKTDSSNATTIAYLKFMIKSLLIFENSFNNFTDAKNKELLENIVNYIVKASDNTLNNSDVLAPLVRMFQNLNKTVANSQDAKSQQDATTERTINNSEYWTDLAKSMSDADFWNKYYNEYWGQASETIRGLGATFKEECKVYGYTSNTNKFIVYIKDFLLKYRVRFNSAQYNEIHNAVANRTIYLDELIEGNTTKNPISVVWCIDLFTKAPKEMKDYMGLDDTFRRSAPQFRTAWMYADFEQNAINSVLNNLDIVRKNGAPVLEGKNAAMSTDHLDAVLADVRKIVKNDNLIANMLILSYLDSDKQQEYLNNYSNYLDTNVSALKLTKARADLEKHGIPSQSIAITLLDKLLTIIQNKKPTQV